MSKTEMFDPIALRTVDDALTVGSPDWIAVLLFVICHAHRRPAAHWHGPDIALPITAVVVGHAIFVWRDGKVAVLWFGGINSGHLRDFLRGDGERVQIALHHKIDSSFLAPGHQLPNVHVRRFEQGG